jgi:protocatechuate 3,4-dioxygenase beta subunit
MPSHRPRRPATSERADVASRREVLATLGFASIAAACGASESDESGSSASAGQLGSAEQSASAGQGASSASASPTTAGAGGGGSGAGLGGGGPTPSCEETAGDIEGPYYTPNAPLLSAGPDGRVVLSPDEPGERIVLSGRVLGASCEPLAEAELDLWQADAEGAYDLQGFVLRGRTQTLSDGSFAIVTVLPGRYLNGATYRPRHLHVKLRAAGHAELTTQLYFPGDPFNESDAFFDERLLVTDEVVGADRFARFDFVLAAS